MMYTIIKTKDKGFGVFVNNDIPKNTKIGEYITNYENKIGRKLPNGYWEEELGRFCNHSSEPNCEIRLTNNIFYLYSICDIEKGDELVTNYSVIEKLLNVEEGRFMDNFINGPKLKNFGHLKMLDMNDKEKIVKEILELKSKKVITPKEKLRIQLLHQELGRFDNEK